MKSILSLVIHHNVVICPSAFFILLVWWKFEIRKQWLGAKMAGGSSCAQPEWGSEKKQVPEKRLPKGTHPSTHMFLGFLTLTYFVCSCILTYPSLSLTSFVKETHTHTQICNYFMPLEIACVCHSATCYTPWYLSTALDTAAPDWFLNILQSLSL